MNSFDRILFIELLGGIGDLVIALPAIHGLARSHPSAHFTVLTFAPGNELLNTDPLIHQVIVAERGAARSTVDQLLSTQTFDLIVSDTNYDGLAEVIQRSSAQKVVTNLWQSPPADQRVGDRFLKLLRAEGLITVDCADGQIHLTQTEKQAAQSQFGASYRPLIFLCIDAGMSIKRWSDANFITVGRQLQQQYGASIVVPVGADQAQAEAIAQSIGGTAQVWQRGSLRQFAAALALADCVIAADTGPARIAAALSVPTITLFGPSWSERYGQPAPHINLQGFPHCPERLIHNFTEQRCWYSGDCPFDWNTCLDEITPQQVLEAVDRLLFAANRSESGASESQRFDRAVEAQNSSREFPLNPSGRERSNIGAGLTDQQEVLTSSSIAHSWQTVRNLLVMRLDNIGDVVMTSPTLRALRQNFPEAKITLMASPAGSLVVPLLPWVDEVLPDRVLWQDLGRLDFDPQREWNLIETLRGRQFDAAIILTSFSQSPHPPALICALAGIPLRLGESKETDIGALTHAILPAPDEIHQVDRNLRLIESIGCHIIDRRLSLQIPHAAQQSIERQLIERAVSPNYLLLNPWTTCQSRNYDPDRFAIAARRLSEITGWSVVVTGVEKDRDRSRSLFTTLGDRAIDFIGATTLPELVALIAQAKLILTNNTSTMHIADAVNTPSVVLFAGTEYECQWQPRFSPSRLLRRPTVCSPCYAFACPYQLECLDIPPETVVEAALEVLQEVLQIDVGDREQMLPEGICTAKSEL